jgi:hypothetical protein
MSSWKELYPASTTLSTPTTAPLPNVVDVVDLRTEFNNLVLGYQGETPIGRSFILRRMRRDDSDNLVKCICVSDLTKEPDRDFPCPYCLGSGNLWDEELITAYSIISADPSGSSSSSKNYPKVDAGATYLPSARFFISYDVAPRKEDRIIEIEIDDDGEVVTPYNRVNIYELTLIRAMRADNGKIEFWACSGQKMGPETLGSVS